ncbi:hypothetical protein BPAE_0172g00070 [Botrytis paeoniae]|uniref:Uncharacterized protein n=1 Tax=Botrytis paeoniae TaxID=278948 RepID=A0A4Z1FCR0_9HELO|nr:hypothetical protein BPAE_0172g00070 [Botrytis paeoniae]
MSQWHHSAGKTPMLFKIKTEPLALLLITVTSYSYAVTLYLGILHKINIQTPTFGVEVPVENRSCSRLSDDLLLTNVDFMTKAKHYPIYF